ncbi:MAG TPA: SDR family oxidoreductase [Solirubrobacteraceae bacterium]|nr:SDR family oxidoreductase [Solirubrobacteraceae bacterium]
MLDSKICLVTGSAGGIGEATALEMARQGAGGVMVSDIDDVQGADTVEQIRALDVDAEYRHCDMGEPDQIRDLIDATVERFGGLDVLHNNAGVHESDFTTELDVETLPEEIFDRVYRINLKGPWLAMKYAAPHLRRSTRGPSIINAGSTGGVTGYPMMNAYGASKGGIIQLTRCVAVDLAPDVRVNAYCPASVDTQMVRKFTEAAEDREAIEAFMVSSHLIPRFGQPIEVGKLVCFLASDDAAWITGGVFPIDGGCLAWRGANT